TGLLSPLPATPPQAPTELSQQWPPTGAEPLTLTDIYPHLADQGYQYGPTFQNLTTAWHHHNDLYAEITLDPTTTNGYLIHPALLDATLHPLLLQRDPDADLSLPFSWQNVDLYTTDATTLRVHLHRDGDRIQVDIADSHGRPVAKIEGITVRTVSANQLARPGTAGDQLYRLEWSPTTADTSDDTPAFVLGQAIPGLEHLEQADDLAEWGGRLSGVDGVRVLYEVSGSGDVHAVVVGVLGVLRRWLGVSGLGGVRLVLVTRGAVSVLGEVVDPVVAAVWGLVRSAQVEHPGRFGLVDVGVGEPVAGVWEVGDEPQVAVRGGRVFVPRLIRALGGSEGSGGSGGLEGFGGFGGVGGGCVLVTGGTGVVGGLVVERVCEVYGVGEVVLVNRHGMDSRVEELVQRLAVRGCRARVIGADITGPGVVEDIVAGLGDRLRAVIHAAGVLHDATIEAMTDDQLRSVIQVKADTAWRLHQATLALDLTAFVMFSSAAGILGSPGQGNYAAGNAFLDALAVYRRHHGLPAQSLAWGLWEQASGMTGHLRDTDLRRVRDRGLLPITTTDGIALFDAATRTDEPVLLPLPLHLPTLRALARQHLLPPILTTLAPLPPTTTRGSDLHRQLTGLDPSHRTELLQHLVITHARAVLGHTTDHTLDPHTPFKDLGFDSLTAVELRNRLRATTNLPLTATIIFDHPTPHALATHLHTQLQPTPTTRTPTTVTTAADNEPIAIIGMACRMPGAVDNPQQLWQLLTTGTDAIGPFPTNRGWNLDTLYHPDPDHPATTYTRHGGFLTNADHFDPDFFHISPREALATDPQHRLLLELTWETLEHAGIDPTTLRDTPTGTYTGIMYNDYATRHHTTPPEYEGLLGNGSAPSIASGRIAYTYGWHGPAITIDTACSSSLVAIHLATNALRTGECTLALAGGATVMATPHLFTEFARQRGLSPDGRCKPFASSADGTGFSEGAGLVLLERLTDAQTNNHPILAIIRGSAINQDGASNGLTAPNGPAQQRVITQALTNARLT
ncbi:SDR family NAD(P)-dependent oxidoreductase, partial [Micromonospora rifamycinica]|uniref:SDR family NAD(P)-dependent oxidoreductase n=1 Tax=Micromonospora rifamycinica TaxID=291594 RepID=UPI00341474DD